MTLNTHLRVTSEGVDPRALFDLTKSLIGAPEGYREEPMFSGGNGWMGAPGQGLPAWLMLRLPDDGETTIAAEEADEDKDPQWQEPQMLAPEAYLELSFDTGYGYRGPDGTGTCSDLHAWMILRIGQWLNDREATWSWENEYTGEWHKGFSGIDDFGSAEHGALS